MSEEAMAIREILPPFMYRKESNNKLEWRELEVFDNGDIYIGQWNISTNKMEGAGVKVMNLGSIYEGYWKDGMKNGKGREIQHDGTYYLGDFKDDKSNGEGLYL